MINVNYFGNLGSIQSEKSQNTSFVIATRKASILVDLSGSPINSLMKADINPIFLDAVFITHSHVDHIYALPSLIHNLWLMKRTSELKVFLNKETYDMAKKLYDIFDFSKKANMFKLKWTIIEDRDFKLLKDIKIIFFETIHGVKTLGATFISDNKKITYSSDTSYFEDYPKLSYGSNLLIHEAGGIKIFQDSLKQKGHSTGYDAAMIASKLGASCLHLCHLPPDKVQCEQIYEEVRNEFENVEIPILNLDYTY